MKKALILLAVLTAVSFALIDVHFGTIQCDTLQADSALVVSGPVTFGDTLHMPSIAVFDNSTLTFYNAGLDAVVQFDSTTQHTEFYSDMVVDSQLTVGDTLALGTSTPEYFFHVYNSGIYNLFEKDADNEDFFIAVDNNHATQELGYAWWRAGTEMWRLEDSNGTFILYDADDTANRMSVDGTTGNFTFYGNVTAASSSLFADSLGISGNASVTGNFVSDMVAPSYNFATASMVTGDGDSIAVDFDPDLTIAPGLTVEFVAEAANTGATTINVDGTIDAVTEGSDQSALEADDIRSGMYVVLKFDGTNWQQVSQSGN